jgi:homocysteine S-methyltransferase
MRTSPDNPIAGFIEQQGLIVLDGGLATTLEARGCDLEDELWSARILLAAPELIRQVHLDFLAAGADCITTSSYQASLAGFRRRGLGDPEAAGLLRRSVELALEARRIFWSDRRRRSGRLRPLVAASVGPYGAFLADGSEYTGRYDLAEKGLREFHIERWRILAETPADLLACETIPSQVEAGVLLSLLEETPSRWAWLSFSCRNGTELCDGSRLAAVAQNCDAVPRVAAVGINCTPPEYIPSLIGEARRVTKKPILVYPNSGERYDTDRKMWVGDPRVDWEEEAPAWRRAGAAGIGGCCRIGPDQIAKLRRRLINP